MENQLHLSYLQGQNAARGVRGGREVGRGFLLGGGGGVAGVQGEGSG